MCIRDSAIYADHIYELYKIENCVEKIKNDVQDIKIRNVKKRISISIGICLSLIHILDVYKRQIIHIYITITSSLDIRLLYFGMIFCEIVLSGIGFFYTPILLFLGLIFAMLIGFPFLFHKLSLLKN